MPLELRERGQPPTQEMHELLDTQVRGLATAWRETAVARDRAGGHAAHERALIRSSGLLDLSIPRVHGGRELPWTRIYDVVRRLARVDSALAHLFAFHHLQVVTLQLYGSEAQQEKWLKRTITADLFWGNALNPNDRRTLAHEDASGHVLRGTKSFCSGSVGADALTVSAWNEAAQALVIGVLAADAPGVEVVQDWDAFGQKQTDSGTVHFHDVRLALADTLVQPVGSSTPRATLRPLFAQLILTHLYLGIAEGAFEEACRFTAESVRPWAAAGVARVEDDPYVQHRMAELRLLLRPAGLMAEHAAAALVAAFDEGSALTAAQRGEVAIAGAEAKVLAHRAAMEVSSRIFEITGARSTSQRFGLDRFWRNARVHTLHDPIDYKLRDIGRYVLEGRHPDPTPYS